MEEKILEKLDTMGKQIGQIEQSIGEFKTETNQSIEKLRVELTASFSQKNKELRQELTAEFSQKNEELRQELTEKFTKKNAELHEKLTESLEKQIIHRMFVFEEDYGKRLKIAYEDLIGRHATEETNSEKITNLERREALNSAYVYNHETRIQELEKSQV